MYYFLKVLLVILLMTTAFESHNFKQPITFVPHKINYVWVGSEEVPPAVQKMIAVWKKNMPDWEIIRWSEKNCPINSNAYAKNMYKQKKFRHVSDYCRAYALEKEGGLYLDTDMYLTHSVEKYLTEPLVLSMESSYFISAGIMAMRPHHPFAKAWLDFYETCDPEHAEDSPQIITRIFYQKISPENFNHKSSVKGQWVIYKPNYMMLNFGGSENVAEHWYTNGARNFSSKSGYYGLFSQYFLDDYAYRLYDETPEQHYAILQPNNMYYLVDRKTNRWWFNKKTGTYTLNKNVLILKEAKIISIYTCKNRKCVLMKPIEVSNPKK